MYVHLALLYATLAACAGLVGWLVYRYDLYDREPWPLLVLASCMGALTMWLAGVLQGELIRRTQSPEVLLHPAYYPALAATTEEVAKLVVVLAIATMFPRHFNDPVDGLIYGAFAGLGAAVEESILVLGRSDQLPMLLPGTEPIRLSGHLIMGGIGASALGFLPLGRRRAARWTLATLAAAMALHFLWDVVAFSAAGRDPDRGPLPWHTAAGIALMLAGMFVFRRLLAVGARLSKQRFAPG